MVRIACPICKGEGRIECITGIHAPRWSAEAPEAEGWAEECAECYGEGWIEDDGRFGREGGNDV